MRFLLLFALAGGAAAQIRDTAGPVKPGSATIAGRVIDAASQPVAGAIVSLSGEGGVPPLTMVTDDSGALAFEALPAIQYRLRASKPAFLTTEYGSQRPGKGGTAIALHEAQEMRGVTLILRRGAVITGRIIDGNGDPAPDAQIRLYQFAMGPTGRGLGAVPLAQGIVKTDGRGIFRVYGLVAGSYVVSAMPSHIGSEGVVRLTTADVGRASKQDTATAEAGVTAAPIYYPGTPVATTAASITVSEGEERSGVDFQMPLVRTSTIDGIVASANGVLPRITMLILNPAPGTPLVQGRIPQTAAVPSDGKFRITSVVPGQYRVYSAYPRPEGGGVSAMIGTADITVDGSDLSGVVIPLQPAINISGRVVFEGATPAPPADQAVVVVSRPAHSNPVAQTLPKAPINSTGQFNAPGVMAGRYWISATMPAAGGASQWALKSVVVDGRDVTDTGFEIAGTNTSTVIVTMIDRVTNFSGTIERTSGQPTADYWILLFTSDRTQWRWESRRVRATRPTTDGTFTFPNLPPGEYFLAAVVDIDDNEWFDPAFLEQVVPTAIRVNAAEGENTVQNIRVAQ